MENNKVIKTINTGELRGGKGQIPLAVTTNTDAVTCEGGGSLTQKLKDIDESVKRAMLNQSDDSKIKAFEKEIKSFDKRLKALEDIVNSLKK